MLRHAPHSKLSRLFFRIFPVPKILLFDPVHIDLDEKMIRLMKIKYKKGVCTPVIHQSYELPRNCVVVDETDTCNEMKQALLKMRDEHDVRFAHVSLPESEAYIFSTQLPSVAKDTVREAVSFVLEENVPLSATDVEYSCAIMPRSSSDHVDVVVTVFPKKIIKAYADLLEEVGITPLQFEVESQALTRAIIPEGDNDSYMLVNFKEARTSVAIVEKGIVHFTSTIAVIGDEILNDLQGDQATYLNREINKLLVYWFTNKNDSEHREKIKKIMVTGPVVSNTSFLDFLKKHVGAEVIPANIWVNCLDPEEETPPLPKDQSYGYGVSLGLALDDK